MTRIFFKLVQANNQNGRDMLPILLVSMKVGCFSVSDARILRLIAQCLDIQVVSTVIFSWCSNRVENFKEVLVDEKYV